MPYDYPAFDERGYAYPPPVRRDYDYPPPGDQFYRGPMPPASPFDAYTTAPRVPYGAPPPDFRRG